MLNSLLYLQVMEFLPRHFPQTPNWEFYSFKGRCSERIITIKGLEKGPFSAAILNSVA